MANETKPYRIKTISELSSVERLAQTRSNPFLISVVDYAAFKPRLKTVKPVGYLDFIFHRGLKRI
jgi:hypothetical protein